MRSAGGGGDDQVDVGFGQDSGIYRGFTRDLQGIGELINECNEMSSFTSYQHLISALYSGAEVQYHGSQRVLATGLNLL